MTGTACHRASTGQCARYSTNSAGPDAAPCKDQSGWENATPAWNNLQPAAAELPAYSAGWAQGALLEPGTPGKAWPINWQRRPAERLRLNVRMASTHLRSLRRY